jgi:hypothetical protein
VVLGTAVNQVAILTEVNQATAALPLPTAQPGICAAPQVDKG